MTKLRLLSVLLLPIATISAQRQLETPRQALGFELGADYNLANYTQLLAWWQHLAAESPRMVLDTIGVTAEGRPQVMAII